MDNKVLGKGLSALIGQKQEERESVARDGVSSLEIRLIKNSQFQPRQDYDISSLENLKSSIKEKGVLQPILVRPSGSGYEVIAGERRLRAARSLGWDTIPVVIKNVTDREAFVLALIENIQRQELNPIEEALGFKRLIEEFHFTQEAVAESVGRDRTAITNLLRLLKLPEDIQALVVEGKLSEGHARALVTLTNTKLQKQLADEVIHKGLSVRQIEAAVRNHMESTGQRPTKAAKAKSRDIQILEEELALKLGTKVSVDNRNNHGKLIIEYYSLDDLDRILHVLRGPLGL